METSESLATKMREALAADGFWALLEVVAAHTDVMNMVHDPSGGGDGPTTAEQLRALNAWEEQTFTKVMPNMQVTGPITVATTS